MIVQLKKECAFGHNANNEHMHCFGHRAEIFNLDHRDYVQIITNMTMNIIEL